MKVLITGATGFVGKNILAHLAKKNRIIAACYKLKKNYSKKVKYIKFNEKILDKLYNIDAVIQCAASTPPKYTQIKCYQNNQKIDDIVFSFAKKKRIKKLIYLSSMSIYGTNKRKVVKESDFSKNLDLYGLSKLKSEKKLLKISKKNIKSILILRLSAILGEGCHSTFLSNLMNRFSKKQSVIIHNKDDLFNGCLHINDLSRFIEKNLANFKNNYDIVNIASYKPVKLEQLINLYKKKYKNIKVVYSQVRTPTYIINVNKAVKKYKLRKINTYSTVKKYLNLD